MVFHEKNTVQFVEELKKAIDNAVNSNSSVKCGSSSGGGTGNRPTSHGGIAALPSLVPSANSSLEVYAQKSVFNDVTENHWAFDAINYLHWKEIITGDENNNFNPEVNITRAEAAKLLCLAFDFEVQNNSGRSFEDVRKDEWFFDYVNALKIQDIVKGDDKNFFNPYNMITREDFSVLIYRIFEKKGMQIEASKNGFTDKNTISSYAAEAVAKLAGKEIVNGFSDGSFRPYAIATRAEAAAVIFRILTGQ